MNDAIEGQILALIGSFENQAAADPTSEFHAGKVQGAKLVLSELRKSKQQAPKPWVYEPKPGDEEKEKRFHLKVEIGLAPPLLELVRQANNDR